MELSSIYMINVWSMLKAEDSIFKSEQYSYIKNNKTICFVVNGIVYDIYSNKTSLLLMSNGVVIHHVPIMLSSTDMLMFSYILKNILKKKVVKSKSEEHKSSIQQLDIFDFL